MMGCVTTFPPAWMPLVDAAGDPYKLAEALHVSHATLWRWAHGERRPSGAARAFVEVWCKRRGLKSPWEES